jgi:hypothetical protein
MTLSIFLNHLSRGRTARASQRSRGGRRPASPQISLTMRYATAAVASQKLSSAWDSWYGRSIPLASRDPSRLRNVQPRYEEYADLRKGNGLMKAKVMNGLRKKEYYEE